MVKRTSQDLVDEYADILIAQEDAIFRGSVKEVRKWGTKLTECRARVDEMGEPVYDALLRLLEHPRAIVKVNAAALLLEHRPDDAAAALERMAGSDDDAAGMALMVLRRREGL